MGFLMVVLISVVVDAAAAFIPKICASNVTLKNAVCCPVPPGFSERCGGPTRGRCLKIISPMESDSPDPGAAGFADDRYNWPSRFLNYSCHCHEGFAGYMCHECKHGLIGQNCTVKISWVRRNYRSLNGTERSRFVEALTKLKSTESDYVLPNTTLGADSLTGTRQFVGASVFDYLAYFHYYVARKTIFREEELCANAPSQPDFAHGSSGFFPWHRAYTLLWERELQKVMEDPFFAIPYWDWTEGNSSCAVCTDDFMGSTNLTREDGSLSRDSALSGFREFCSPKRGQCDVCDPSAPGGYLVRRPASNPKHSALPTREEVEFSMAQTRYDTPNYDKESSSQSFRNTMEGFADRNGPTELPMTHNNVHVYMNGTFSTIMTAAYDPIFLLHHSFVDKLFEKWYRKNQPSIEELPLIEARPGHNRLSNMVPFFPVQKVYEFFQDSRSFGYSFDDMIEDEEADSETDLNPMWILVIVEGGIVLFLIVFIVKLCRKSKAGRREDTQKASTAGEAQPLLGADGNPEYQSHDATHS